MSYTTNNVIVQATFKGEQFQEGVADTIKSLNQLDKTLDEFGNNSSDGFSTLAKQAEDAVPKIDSIGDSLHNITSLVEPMKEVFVGAFFTIGQKAVEAGEKIVSGIVDQYKAAWSKMDSINTSVQTIMSATGGSMEYTQSQLDRLTWFADETSYSLEDMTGNIAKFTAQNVDLETSVTAMEGIALAAAKAGQNASTASRAMYNISQALGIGYMQVADWKSIELANMATTELKSMALETAAELGTLVKDSNGKYWEIVEDGKDAVEVTVENFRSTLADKWFTSDVITATFGKYGEFADELSKMIERFSDAVGITASEALGYIDDLAAGIDSSEVLNSLKTNFDLTDESAENLLSELERLADEEYDFGRAAFEAGQQAISLTQAIDATKDAASSAWAGIYQTILGNYETGKEFWTNIAEDLYNIFVEPINSLSGLITNVFGSPWQKVAGEVVAAGYSIDDFKAKIIEVGSNGETNLEALINQAGGFDLALQKGTIKVEDLNKALDALESGGYTKVTEGANKAIESAEKMKEILDSVYRGDYGNDMGENGEIRKNLTDAGYDADAIQYLLNQRVAWGMTEDAALEYYNSLESVATSTEEIVGNSLDGARDSLNGLTDEYKSGSLLLTESIHNIMSTIGTVVGYINDAFFGSDGIFSGNAEGAIRSFLLALNSGTEKLKTFVEENEGFKNSIKTIAKILKWMSDTILDVLSVGWKLIKILSSPLRYIISLLWKAVSFLTSIFVGVDQEISKTGSLLKDISKWLSKIVDHVSEFFNDIMPKFDAEGLKKTIISMLKSAYNYIEKIIKRIKNIDFSGFSSKALSFLSKFKSAGISTFEKLLKLLKENYGYVKELYDKYLKDKINLSIENMVNKMRDLKDMIKTIDFSKLVTDFAQSATAKLSDFSEGIKEVLSAFDPDLIIENIKDCLQYAKDYVKEFISNLNLNEVIDNILSNIKTAMINGQQIAEVVWEAIKKLFSNLWSEIKNIDYDYYFSKIVKLLWDGIKWIASKIAEGFVAFTSPFINRVKEFFSNTLPNSINGTKKTISDCLKSFGEWFSSKMPNLGDVFKNVGEDISSLFSGIKEKFENFKVWLSQFWAGVKDFVAPIGDVLFPYLSPIINAITAFVNDIKASLDAGTLLKDLDEIATIFLKFSIAFANIKGAMGLGKVAKSWKYVSTSISNGVTTISTASKNLLDTLSSTGSASITTVIKSFSSIFTSFGGIFTSISNVIDSYTKINKSISFMNIAKSLLMIAAALAICVGAIFAIYLLYQRDKEAVDNAAIIIGSILAELALILFAMDLMANSLAKKPAAMIGAFVAIAAVMAAFYIVAMAMLKFNEISDEELSRSESIMTNIAANLLLVIGILALLTKGLHTASGQGKTAKKFSLGSTTDMEGIALAFLAISASFLIIGYAIEKMATVTESISQERLNTILKVFGIVAGIIAAISIFAGLSKLTWSAGVGVLAIAASMVIMSEAIIKLINAVSAISLITKEKKVNETDINNLRGLIGLVVAMGAVMAGLALVSGFSDFGIKQGLAFVSVALALIIIVEAINKLIKVIQSCEGNWVTAGVSMGALIAFIVVIGLVINAISKTINDKDVAKVGTAFLLVAISLIAVVIALNMLINKVQETEWQPAATAIAALAIFVTLIGYFIAKISAVSSGGEALKAGAAFLLVALSLVAVVLIITYLIKTIEGTDWVTATAAIGVVIGALAVIGALVTAITKITSTCALDLAKAEGLLLGLIVLVGLLGVVAYGYIQLCEMMSSISDENVQKFLDMFDNIVLVVGALFGALALIGEFMPGGAVIGALAFDVLSLGIMGMVDSIAKLAVSFTDLITAVASADAINWEELTEGVKGLWTVLQSHSYDSEGGLVSDKSAKNIATVAEGLAKLAGVVNDPAFATLMDTTAWENIGTSLSNLFSGYSDVNFSSFVSTLESSAVVVSLENLGNSLHTAASGIKDIEEASSSMTGLMTAFQKGNYIRWDEISTGMANVWTAVKDNGILGGLASKFKNEDISSLAELITDLEKLSQVVMTEGFRSLSTIDFEGIGTKINGLFTLFKGDGGIDFSGLVSTIENSRIISSFENLGTSLKTLSEGLSVSETGLNSLSGMITVCKDAWSIPWYTISTGLTNVFNAIEGRNLNTFDDQAVANVQSFATSIQTLSDTMVSDNFVTFMNSDYGSITDKVNAMLGSGEINDTSADSISGIVEKLQNLTTSDSFMNLGTTLGSINTGMSEMTNTFGEISGISGMLSSLNTELNTSVGDWNNLSSNFTSVFTGDGSVDESSFMAITNQLTNLESNGTIENLGGALSSFSEGLEATETSISSINTDLDELEETTTARKENWYEIGKNLSTGLAEGIVDSDVITLICDNAAQAVKDAEEAARKAGEISSPSKLFAEIGSYLTEGMAEGMVSSSAILNLCNRAASAVYEAVAAARRAAKIHSPSKLFAEVGGYMTEGMAVGMDKNIPMVEESSDNLVDAAKDALLAIYGATDEILDEDGSITITPVLDLSEVQAGASSLSSMFGNRTIGLASNVSSTSKRIQNGSSSDSSQSAVVSLDKESLAALSRNSGSSEIDLRVSYEGSLAYLASILQPAITAESKRIGVNLVNG